MELLENSDNLKELVEGLNYKQKVERHIASYVPQSKYQIYRLINRIRRLRRQKS